MSQPLGLLNWVYDLQPCHDLEELAHCLDEITKNQFKLLAAVNLGPDAVIVIFERPAYG